MEHTHKKKTEEESRKYDNHYCQKHEHLAKEAKKEKSKGQEGQEKGEKVKTVEVPKVFSRDEAFFNGKTFLTVSAQLHLEAMSR